MARILVLYYSEEGRTRQMAEHVAAGAAELPGTDVRLRDVTDDPVQDVVWCDGMALGAPTHMGSIPWRMKQFWDEALRDHWMQIDGKIGCAFSSEGGYGGGAELNCLALQVVMMNYGMMVFGVTDYVAEKFTLHYGATVALAPRQQREIDVCLRLGRRLAEWVGFYVDHRPEVHPARAEYPRKP
jgi:NAD(P)H dehydrogenase (quinone)